MTNNSIKVFSVEVSMQDMFKRNEEHDISLSIGNSDDWLKDIDFMKNKLDVSEQNRALKFLRNEDRNTYISTHYFLRKELSKILKIPQEEVSICTEQMQKPFLKSDNLDFNISHSSNYFAIIVANSENVKVGVDIEKVNKQIDIEDIINEYMHEDEIVYVKNGKGLNGFSNERFLEIWTRKEAFLKMLGTGIDSHLQSVNMVLGKRLISVEMPKNLDLNISRAYIYTISTKDYILSCSISEPRKVTCSLC